MINRRSLILAGAAALCSPSVARSEIRCSPYNQRGIQYCEAGVRIRNFVTAQQQCQNWCWAACVEAVFSQKGYRVSQREIVERIYPNLGCYPATGPQIVEAISGHWVDRGGRDFEAWGSPVIDRSYGIWNFDSGAIIARELAAGNPLIIGSLSHATRISAITYYHAYDGTWWVASITVRDPWPGNPNRRLLSQQEARNANLVIQIFVG